MPSADLAPLIQLAKLDAKDIALRDKALEALGRADAGRGSATLLLALDDQRARIAIYALRRSILKMPAKSALSLLVKAPRNKVTVEKEIIRLAGELTGDEAYRFLNSYAQEKDLHPDVQIALLRAFWKHLNTPEVWLYFHHAAQSDVAALARSTIRLPQEGLSPTAMEHLAKQMTLLLRNKNAQVRLETVERLVAMPIEHVDPALFDSLAQMLEETDVKIGRLAATAMLAGYISKTDNQLAITFAKVNRPKSIAAIIDAFLNNTIINITALQLCGESLALILLKQRRLPSQALHLAISLLAPANILTIIDYMDRNNLLHPGVIENNQNNWHKALINYSPHEISNLELKLRLSPSEKYRRLGLGLLVEQSGQYGWTTELCDLLAKYWADNSLWVSEVAGLIEPPQVLA